MRFMDIRKRICAFPDLRKKAVMVAIPTTSGTGSEVMSRIAAPMVGGMVSSTVLTLGVIPALYALVKQWRLKRGLESTPVPTGRVSTEVA